MADQDTSTRPSAELEQRFWKYVQKTDSCWIWTGAKSAGRGAIGRGGGRASGTVLAYRLSWELHRGPIPAGLCVCHHCDVPECVNPDHLFMGTRTDNNRDMCANGRHWSQQPGRDPYQKTHCQSGRHEFTVATTAWRNGRRRCKLCARETRLAHDAAKAKR